MKRTLIISIEVEPLNDEDVLAPYIELALRRYITGLRVPAFSSPEAAALAVGRREFEEFSLKTNSGALVTVRAAHRVDE
jgi:hypothetical protein